MVGGLKVLVVKAGFEEEFESLFRRLRKAIWDAEPGCSLYSLLKSRRHPRSYIVHEQYRDQVALADHEASPHGEIYFPQIRDVLETTVTEYFDVVVK